MSLGARAIVAVLVVLGVTAGTVALWPRGADRAFTAALEAESSGGTVVLQDQFPGDWTHMLPICPYESSAAIAEQLAPDWEWDESSTLLQNEGEQAFVLLDESGALDVFGMSRRRVDFCGGGAWPTVIERGSILTFNYVELDGVWYFVRAG